MKASRIPNVTFRTRKDHEWVDVTSEEIFAGKNVVVFSLPGAFTPTCSSSHVPRYNQLVPQFKAHGIDEVICVSVNDAFVMNEWQRAQKGGPSYVPARWQWRVLRRDGPAGWQGRPRFRTRSWRYSMLVRDGVVEKMFIEPEEPGDPFSVSDADTMLKYLDPGM